ncbi:MAG: DNA gyrase subunit A, partial [SAR202 cluster bacterium]|nr:DNA gyrase subunit A [SAR202 cluster bacterium]
SSSGRRFRIIVTELPYQVNKSELIAKTALLVKNKRIEGISEIRDESDRDGMRIVYELRNGVQPQVILNNLYKQTALQSSFSANMLALIDGKPALVTLKTAVQQYIKFRQEVIRRRTEFELKKAEDRAHILAGLRIAIQNLDEVIALIRSSDDVESARTDLMSKFDLDQPQAQAILDMQLRRLAALEIEKLENEYQDLQKLIKDLKDLLADEDKIRAVVKDETEELKTKVADKRRTQISSADWDLSREELEAHEQIVITYSQGGYVKRIPSDTFRRQHRGGKGVSGMNTKDGDPIKDLLVVDTHDKLMFFTNKGRVLSKVGYELRADVSRNTRGVPVANIINVWDTESISALIGVGKKQYEEYQYLVLGTRKGRVKRINLSDVEKIRPSGLIIMNLKDDDELVSVKLAKDDDDIIFISEQGMGIRFSVNDLPIRRRAAGGVKGMSLRTGDRVVAMDVGNDDSRLMVISKLGKGKINRLGPASGDGYGYRRQGRAGLGLRAMNLTKNTGPVADAQIVDDAQEVYIVSENAQIIRIDLREVKKTKGRISQGVKIFDPKPGDSVSSLYCAREFEIEDEPAKEEKTSPKKSVDKKKK